MYIPPYTYPGIPIYVHIYINICTYRASFLFTYVKKPNGRAITPNDTFAHSYIHIYMHTYTHLHPHLDVCL